MSAVPRGAQCPEERSASTFQAASDPVIDAGAGAHMNDPAPLDEDLGRERSTVVFARHRERVGARVTNHDVRRLFVETVVVEIVGTLAHGADDAIIRASCGSIDGFDPVGRLIEGRSQEVVHPRINHQPAPLATHFGLDHLGNQDPVASHEAPPRLHDEHQIRQPFVFQESDGCTCEIMRRRNWSASVVDPEAPTEVDVFECVSQRPGCLRVASDHAC